MTQVSTVMDWQVKSVPISDLSCSLLFYAQCPASSEKIVSITKRKHNPFLRYKAVKRTRSINEPDVKTIRKNLIAIINLLRASGKGEQRALTDREFQLTGEN